MTLKKNLLNYTINFILALLMSFSFTYALTTTLGFKYQPVLIIAVIAGFIAFFTILFLNKFLFKISGSITAFAIIGFISYLIYNYSVTEVLNTIEAYFNWFNEYIIQQNRVIIPGYNLILLIIICFLISLFTYLFTIKKFKFLIILIFGIVLFTLQWAFQYFASYFSFYLFLFLILIYYFRHVYTVNSSKEVNEYAYSAVFTLFIIPVCAIIFISSYLIPSKPKPVEWKWLDSKINSFCSYIIHGGSISKFDYFSVESTGFGNNNGDLGGKVKKNKILVLKVDSPRPVYLKGSIKDFYTGTSWKETGSSINTFSASENQKNFDYDNLLESLTTEDNIDTSNRSYLDYTELLAGMSMITNGTDFLKKYFFSDTIKITYQNLQTKSMFFSNSIYKILAGKSTLQVKPNGIISSKDRLAKKFNYSFNAYTLKIGDKNLTDILRKSYKGFYDDYYNNMSTFNNDLYDASEYACSGPEPVYRIISEYGYNALIYSKPSNGDIPENTRQILGKYNISTDSNTVTKYPLLRGNNMISYLVPLDDSINSLLGFNIAGKDIKSIQFYKSIYDLLKNNSHEAYTKYVQLPKTLPKRVKDLALSITSSYTNQYDKVKAVEKYLSGNYTYTLSPKSVVPKGRDFVDYFLFDLKQGYCTYYATSMAVMLRSLGIPARYVEGYALSSRPKKGTVYDVTNERAHAWVEVYFEGFGWIPFEPTASFDASFYSNRKTPSSPNGSDPTEMMRRQRNGSASGIHNINAVQNAKNAPKNNNYFWLILILAICIPVLAITTLILVNAARSKLKIRKHGKLPPKESILASYKYCLELLSIAGYEMLPGETPFIYSERIDRFFVSKPTSFESVTDVFVLARYSQNQLEEKDKEYLNSYVSELTGKVKARSGKIKYFVNKFILGKI